MNMAAPHKSSAEIRSRLLEIDASEKAHAVRDLDKEVHDVLRSGGDIDALEEVHLQAERVFRRLRVEKSALTAELEIAVQREAEQALRDIVRQHDELVPAAVEKRDALCKAWSAFESELNEWLDLQATAFDLTEAGVKLAWQNKNPAPALGMFLSERLADVCRESQKVFDKLYATTESRSFANSVQGHRLD